MDILSRLEADVMADRPDAVVLLVGTNDLLNSTKAVSLKNYRENLRALVKRITEADTRVLLVTIPPVYEPYLAKRHGAEFYGTDGPEGRIAAGNEVIRDVAQENRVPVVDLFAALQHAGGASDHPASLIRNLANSTSEDGVHPTIEGYRLMGTLVAEVIVKENLQHVSRIACLGDSITFGVHMAGEGTSSGDTYPSFLARALEARDLSATDEGSAQLEGKTRG